MNKKIFITGGALLTLAAIIAIPQLTKKETIVERLDTIVETTLPERNNIELQRSVIGSVEPSDVVYVYPKMAGKVLSVNVKTGDYVNKDDLICIVDTMQIENAKLTLDAASMALNTADINLERQKILYQSGDISTAAYEQAEMQAKSARIQYEQAKLNYDNQIDFSNIKASISGMIETCNIKEHDTIAQQSLICVIAGSSAKTIKFAVSEKIANFIKPGDEIKIEKNDMKYIGYISEVSNMVNQMNGLFDVKATVDNADALATGTNVKVLITYDKAIDTLTIPTKSVYYSNEEPYVFIYENGKAKEVKIESGLYNQDNMEIISGLDENDEIIKSWNAELYDGATVKKVDK